MQKILRYCIVFLVIISVSLTGCVKSSTKVEDPTKNNTRTIVDMAGRKVTIPKTVKKVYSVNPVGTIMVYTLCPSKIAGWNYELTDNEKKYILKEYQNLPNLGSIIGNGNSGNPEEIIKANPDVIICMGDINDTTVSNVEKVQKQLNIPVVIVDGNINKLDKAYEFVGDVIGEKSTAKKLADYCNKTITETKAMVEKIPEEKRVKVYYAEGLDGLQTDPKGSSHTEVLDLVKGINAADIGVKKGNASPTVSIEQVVSWNPDLILVGFQAGHEGGTYNTIIKDEKWENIKAVKDKKVYEIPQYPFNWFDRPPSVNRIIGIRWLANLIYPDYVKIDIKAEVKEFYSEFYHYNLTDDEVNNIINHN